MLSSGPRQLDAAPVDLSVPALAPSELGRWCTERKAAGTAGLSTRARQWLNDCIAIFGGSSPTSSPSASSSPTGSPSPTSSPSASASPSPTVTASPTATTTPGGNPLGALPRIAWEGGPEYWRQFPDASNWTDPNFFPIGIWYNGISTDAEVQWDKAHGINSYFGMVTETPYDIFARNGVYWLGQKLNSSFATSGQKYWPGVFLDDEIDGTSATWQEAISRLTSIESRFAGSGKFTYANYTSLVVQADMPKVGQEALVNFPDVFSTDQYFYTVPYCSWTNYRGGTYAVPIPQSTCRTASSYGKLQNSMTIRNASDNKLTPQWSFIENLNGGPGLDQPFQGNISPAQVKGAAMNAIINEARGIFWFNQSFNGTCQVGSALRTAQVRGSSWCGSANMDAMGEVNNLIKSLAPVINTQSYDWTFGAGLDTMLKWQDGSAYVFAMAADGGSGQRTFTLPAGLSGAVTVVSEGRTLPVSGGAFVDGFAAESSYHVYKIG